MYRLFEIFIGTLVTFGLTLAPAIINGLVENLF